MKVALVVDDNELFRGLIVELLLNRFPNVKILQAKNGREGRDKFLENSPDAVITDFEMPGMNGLELAKFIKDNPREDIRVIMISGLVNSEELQAKVEGLGFKFFKKPFQLEEFEQVLSELVKQ